MGLDMCLSLEYDIHDIDYFVTWNGIVACSVECKINANMNEQIRSL